MVIFFLNVGRSGSMAVAKAFNLLHEPDGYFPSVQATKQRSAKTSYYGETSHFWKAQLDKLTEAFPDGIFIHLVRNGKNTVRSFYCSTHHYLYYRGEPAYRNESLPIEGFEKMTRFEKLCWYWRYWNEEIEKYAKYRVKLEDLKIPIVNDSYKKEKYWTKEMHETFERICGNLNRKYGYEGIK